MSPPEGGAGAGSTGSGMSARVTGIGGIRGRVIPTREDEEGTAMAQRELQLPGGKLALRVSTKLFRLYGANGVGGQFGIRRGSLIAPPINRQ